MKIREHGFLLHLERQRTKVKPITEVAEICRECIGKCKSEPGLSVCGKRTRERMKSK